MFICAFVITALVNENSAKVSSEINFPLTLHNSNYLNLSPSSSSTLTSNRRLLRRTRIPTKEIFIKNFKDKNLSRVEKTEYNFNKLYLKKNVVCKLPISFDFQTTAQSPFVLITLFWPHYNKPLSNTGLIRRALFS